MLMELEGEERRHFRQRILCIQDNSGNDGVCLQLEHACMTADHMPERCQHTTHSTNLRAEMSVFAGMFCGTLDFST